MEETAKKAHDDAAQVQLGAERVTLGPYTSYSLGTDPKHLCFVLSRYKFCARLLEGKSKVLEIGCGDAIGLPIVAQAVGHVWATDWDSGIIEDNKKRVANIKNCTFSTFNIVDEPFSEVVNAVYLLDVIEHLHQREEEQTMLNITKSLSPSGICIVGTPNSEASRFASPQSQAGHINLKSHDGLRVLMQGHFENVFLFSMNDEVVHTGFYPLAHYLFGIGAGLKRRASSDSGNHINS